MWESIYRKAIIESLDFIISSLSRWNKYEVRYYILIQYSTPTNESCRNLPWFYFFTYENMTEVNPEVTKEETVATPAPEATPETPETK